LFVPDPAFLLSVFAGSRAERWSTLEVSAVAHLLLTLWLRQFPAVSRSSRRHPTDRPRSYRPLLETLEERLPPGDAAGGALLGGLLLPHRGIVDAQTSPRDGSSSDLSGTGDAGTTSMGTDSGSAAATGSRANADSSGSADAGGTPTAPLPSNPDMSPSGGDAPGSLPSTPLGSSTPVFPPLVPPSTTAASLTIANAFPAEINPLLPPASPGHHPLSPSKHHLPAHHRPHRVHHGHMHSVPATSAPNIPVVTPPDVPVVPELPPAEPAPPPRTEPPKRETLGTGSSTFSPRPTLPGGTPGSGNGSPSNPGPVNPPGGGGGSSSGPGSGKSLIPVTPPSVSGPVNSSDEPGNLAEVAIAADPRHPGRLFLEANNEGPGGNPMFISRSLDNGATWIDSKTIGTGSDGFNSACCDPSVAFDKYGNLFMSYLDSSTNSTNIYLSTDDGATFTFLANIPGSQPNKGVDQGTLATGPSTDGVHSSVWLTFSDFNGTTQIAVTGAPVVGLGQVGSFTPLFLVPGSQNGNFGDIAVGPQGQVIVTYQHSFNSPGPDDIEVSTKSDGFGPGGFSTPIVVTGINIGGFTPIPAQPNRTIDSEAGLAWDRSGGPHTGRVYLMFTDAPTVANPQTDTHVFLEFSDDGGQTWCNPVQVDDATFGTRFLPKLALDQTTGNLGVSFYDTRNDPANRSPEFFMAFSTNGGRSFQPNIQITTQASNVLPDQDNGFDYGDYTGAAYDHGVFHPAWSDNSDRSGDPDEHLEIVSAAIRPGTFTTPEDAFEPNETSDKAVNLGAVNFGETLTVPNLSISKHVNNLPDYDWFKWTPTSAGIFTVTFDVGESDGDLELHLFTVDKNGTLVELGNTNSGISGSCISGPPGVQVVATAGETLLVEVKGVESQLGKWGVGFYDLNASLS
jgi:hypothetical protein